MSISEKKTTSYLHKIGNIEKQQPKNLFSTNYNINNPSTKLPAAVAWRSEVSKSISQEMYPIFLGDSFIGIKFNELSLLIFEKFGCLLFALSYVQEINGEDEMIDVQIKINPFNYCLNGGEVGYYRIWFLI